MKYGKVWDNPSRSRIQELAGIEGSQVNEAYDKKGVDPTPDDVKASIEQLQKLFEQGNFDEAGAYAAEVADSLKELAQQKQK